MDHALPAYYRSQDPIENLVVRVSIRRKPDAAAPRPPAAPGAGAGAAAAIAAGSAPLGGASLTLAAGQPLALHASLAAPGGGPAAGVGLDDEYAEKVVDFGWQEKVLGPR